MTIELLAAAPWAILLAIFVFELMYGERRAGE